MVVDGENLPDSFRTAPTRPTSRVPATASFLVLLPVTWVAFDVLALELFGASDSAMGFGASDSSMASLLFATLTNWVVVGADSAALRRAGVQVSAWWGILLLPLYVILRTRVRAVRQSSLLCSSLSRWHTWSPAISSWMGSTCPDLGRKRRARQC
jgi:hypothetical protein